MRAIPIPQSKFAKLGNKLWLEMCCLKGAWVDILTPYYATSKVTTSEEGPMLVTNLSEDEVDLEELLEA